MVSESNEGHRVLVSESFVHFLLKAKKSTYADSGGAGDALNKDGSKSFSYDEDSWSYTDVYVGYNPFSGQEIVRKDGLPFWSMNYYGSVKKKDVKEVYRFLKQAMLRVDSTHPFRGPAEFSQDDWTYTCKQKGTLDNFEGKEKIFFQKELVYKLLFHGGILRPKDKSL